MSLLFGAADSLAGGDGVRVVVGLLTLGVFAVAWRLTRPTQGLLVRVAIAGLVIGIGNEEWSERPLLVGLIAFGLTVLAGEGELDPRWLLPVAWVWANSHGSFPLGVAYLLVVALGRRLDHLDVSVELRALRWLVGGFALAAVNPLGPRLLVFPVELFQKQDVLRHIVEWRSPGFESLGERLFLVQVVLAVVALVRRPRYRGALVVGAFTAAALVGSRNIAIASIAVLPVLAEAWRDVGRTKAATRDGMARLLGVAGVVLLVAVTATRLGEPAYQLDAYPVRAIDLLEDGGVDLEELHLASVDLVGNYLELRYGPGQRVFFDDRFDMFPADVSADAFALLDGRPRSTTILDDRGIDLVLWPRQKALTAILGANPAWDALDHGDPDWMLFCRVGVQLSAALGTC